MSIGDGRKTYSDSTLKSMTKDGLIEVIRSLESNLRKCSWNKWYSIWEL